VPPVLRGIGLLARGRREGFAEFGGKPDDFLASLGPLLAFPLLGAILLMLSGHGLLALRELLPSLCAILAPPVLSQALAQLWHRDEPWLAYATAFNWCRVLVLVALLAVGLPVVVARVLLVALIIYLLWLDWFLARYGLEIGPWQAVIVVLTINMGTAALVFGPAFLD